MRGADRTATILAWLLVLSWGLGQLLGGRTYFGNLLFHLPTPAVALVLLGLAVRSRPSWRWAWRTGALALLPLVVLAAELRFGRSAPLAGTSLEVVHWNAGRGRVRAGWDVGRPLLAELRPDLIALSEAPRGAELDTLLAELGPEYRLDRRLGLAFLGRGSIEPRAVIAEDGLQAWVVRWTPPGGRPLLVLMADLPSNPLLPREAGLRRIVGLIVTWSADLVLGDFNAPRQSAVLRRLPGGRRHCHDEAGQGLGLTWPAPVPLFAIDHCITGPALSVSAYDLIDTKASDHRLQRVRVVQRRPTPIS